MIPQAIGCAMLLVMKMLISALLMMIPLSADAIEDDLDERYRTGRAMQYWGLGSGVIGGAAAVPLTMETLRFMRSLRHHKNPVEACVKTVMAVLFLPPMLIATGAVWVGGVGGSGVGLGGSLVARGALVDAGGKVTPVPAIVGIASLSATPAFLIIGIQNQDEDLVLAGIGTFAGASALLLTQSLLNGAKYRQLNGTQRNIVIPPITIGGRF